MLRADSGDKTGDALFKKFAIQATPTILFLSGDGSEIDWIVGYDPPADKFHEKILKIVAGEDTYKAVAAAYAKNPKDVATVSKLARKWADRYDTDKAVAKFKEVVALDPEGRAGSFTPEYEKGSVTYTEHAEFSIAQQSVYTRGKPDPAPMLAFLKKYPATILAKTAYAVLGNYFSYQASKEQAIPFFAEYTARFPEDAGVLASALSRIVRDKEPLDKGVALAEKIQELTESNPLPRYNRTMAEFYTLKGDAAKAEELYGKSFMEGRASSLSYDLVQYASFWLGKKGHEEDVVTMADLALKLNPEASYIIQQAVTVYLKAGLKEKALEIYGPAFLQKKGDKASNLSSYAGFWSNQGLNLDSALEAAKKAVTLQPDAYYMWITLSNVHLKLKNYEEAIKAAETAVEKAEGPTKDYAKKQIDRIKAAQAADKK